MGAAATFQHKPATVKMPWGLSLFLLMIFALAGPFDPSYSGHLLEQTLNEMSQAVQNGSVQRQIALLSLGLFAFAALFSKRRGRLRVKGPLGWSLLFFLFLALASPAWAEDASLTLRRVGVLVLLYLGAVAVAARVSQTQTVALTVCVCGLTLFISLAVEIASGTFSPLDGAWRFSGVLHPVIQGWNCGLLAIASLALAAAWPQSRNRFILLALVALLFFGLTRSRMPLASTIFASAVCGCLVSRKVRRLTFVTVCILVCAGVLWIYLERDLGNAARVWLLSSR